MSGGFSYYLQPPSGAYHDQPEISRDHTGMVVEDNDEEIDVTEVSGDFFLAPESDKVREARSVSGPNLQAVTEALFDNCEDYQNIQNKSSTLWRPY